MPGTELTIEELKKNGTLEELQEKLSRVTGLAFLTVDFRGMPVTEMTGFTEYCRFRRMDENYSKNCILSNVFGGATAAISNKPYIYRCHAGLVHIAVSIVIKEQFLGTLLCGQVKCKEAEELDDFSKRFSDAVDWRKEEKLSRSFDEIPEVSYEKMEQIGELMRLYVQLMCERETLRLEQQERDGEPMMIQEVVRQHETEEKGADPGPDMLTASMKEKNITDTFLLCRKTAADIFSLYYKEEDRFRELEKIREYCVDYIGTLTAGKQEYYEKKYQLVTDAQKYPCIAEAFLHFLMQDVYRLQMISKYPQFNVILSYIHGNIEKEITLNEISEMCTMSTGYITRIFKRYYGVGVVDYAHLIKILWAKLYLACTELSISDISYSLGYNDPGYFGKVFKKYEGMTPSLYKRSYHCQGYNIRDSFGKLFK